MATPAKSIRFPAALGAAIEKEAQRSGRSFSEVVIDDMAIARLGHDVEPERSHKPAPTRKAPVSADPRRALAQAEARAGVRPAHLDTSMVAVHDGGKRPAYQKGSGAKPKR